MLSAVIVATITQAELTLIVEALSAYQHNTRFRPVYEKMLRQKETPDERIHLYAAA